MPDRDTAHLCAHEGPKGRCRAYRIAGQPTCPWHSPELRDAVKAAQVRGGHARAHQAAEAAANPLAHLPMTTLEECRAAAETVTRGVLAGTIPARSGQVAASLIRAAMTAVQAAESEALAAEVEAARAAAPPSVGRKRR